MNNLLRVFEHDVINVSKNGIFKRKHWEILGKYNQKNSNKYFTLLHNGVRFNQHVGVIQAGKLTIEILPKADKVPSNDDGQKDKWRDLLLQMLKKCRHIDLSSITHANLSLRSSSLIDLYLEAYLTQLQSLLHKGLVKKYRKEECNRTALKGRLLFAKQITKNSVHQERFYTSAQVYDSQHLINQLLYKALILLPKLTFSPRLLDKASRVILDFPEMKDIKVSIDTFSKVKLGRKTLSYLEPLALAKMILLNYSPDIKGGDDHILAILFDMNKLWEEYIYRVLVSANSDPELTISRQSEKVFWKKKKIKPDIVFEKKADFLILDTKWKLCDDGPSDDDLKQMFAYNNLWKSSHSILLYPGAITGEATKGIYTPKRIGGENLGDGLEHYCIIKYANVSRPNGEKWILDENLGDTLISYVKNLLTPIPKPNVTHIYTLPLTFPYPYSNIQKTKTKQLK